MQQSTTGYCVYIHSIIKKTLSSSHYSHLYSNWFLEYGSNIDSMAICTLLITNNENLITISNFHLSSFLPLFDRNICKLIKSALYTELSVGTPVFYLSWGFWHCSMHYKNYISKKKGSERWWFFLFVFKLSDPFFFSLNMFWNFCSLVCVSYMSINTFPSTENMQNLLIFFQ